MRKYGRFLPYLVSLAAGAGLTWILGRGLPWSLLLVITAVALGIVTVLMIWQLKGCFQFSSVIVQ